MDHPLPFALFRAQASASGFTLVELVVTLAIAATLTTLAWPAMQSLVDRQRLRAASERLAGHLQLARSEAIARNETVHLSVLPAHPNGRCYVLHTGAAAQCSCAGGCTAPHTALQTVALPTRERVQLEAPAGSLHFDPHLGTCTPTATFKLVAPDGTAIHQVVNLVGRVRSCSPDAKVPGHAAC